jgi:hypothetical protein
MMYFDWTRFNVGDYLLDPALDKIKDVIARKIRDDLLKPDYVADWYRYDPLWLEAWSALASEEEQIQAINQLGWGPLSPSEGESGAAYLCQRFLDGDKRSFARLGQLAKDYAQWELMSQPQYRDPQTLQHWCWLHGCQCVVLFVWKLVALLWPDDRFVVCWDGYHAYVMKVGDPHTIFDILWYASGIPISQIEENASSVTIYPDPLMFLAREHLAIPNYPDLTDGVEWDIEELLDYAQALA